MTNFPVRAKSLCLAACLALCALPARSQTILDRGMGSGLRPRFDLGLMSPFLAEQDQAISRLGILPTIAVPTAFERSFVVRLARIFIDKVQVAQLCGLRIRLKIILE